MRVTAIVLLFITGISAAITGYHFITEPSGKGLGISTAYLRYSPFSNFFIPGIVLFIANGIMSIATAITVLFHAKFSPILIWFQGCILTSWIIIQVILVRDFNVLHFAFLSTGISLFLIGRSLTLQYKY